ncbi:MAG: rRNA maturation RNase YbeY [Planctomycetota bacterium]
MDEPERIEVSDQRPVAEPVVDLASLAAVAAAVLAAEGRAEARLSLAVLDDEQIAELHGRFLQDPTPTDVISFPLEDEHDALALLGEVVVSADTAAREAAARGLPFAEELLRYVVHGTLHLLGYDDHDPADHDRMHARQEELLQRYLAGPGAVD